MKEAIEYTDEAIEAAKRRGDTTISIIVGSHFLFSKRWTVLRMIEGFALR